jgi:hypothetical protein
MEIDGLQLSIHSARDQGDGLWTISAYATDDAESKVQALGCTIDEVMTSEQVRRATRSGRRPDAES